KEIYGVPLTFSPAAAETLKAHFEDTGKSPSDYDLILTGDLGLLGKEIMIDLMNNDGIDIKDNYNDCGCLIFNGNRQDTHAGGSGCGCGAVTLTGFILTLMKEKKLNDVLFMATGALLSPTSTLQGESIPAIAHAISISNRR
ncbi:MAG: stage V sporulation protein AD, partial [Clostridia bacterium]|nr:stage V sporulation protein AD [Clostridia bacterium]